MKDSDLIIKQIHSDFDLAQDNLLQQANDFLQKYNTNIDIYEKAKRLKTLGFENCIEVKETEDDIIYIKKN